MSYDLAPGKNKKTKPAAESQSLLSDQLRQANIYIDGQLTKLQNYIRNLTQLKDQIGTPQDSKAERTKIADRKNEINAVSKDLKGAIDEYLSINVPSNQQKQQTEKHGAYSKRFSEIYDKQQFLSQEVDLKMQQNQIEDRQNSKYGLSLQQQDANNGRGHDESAQSLLQYQEEQFDIEEQKIQAQSQQMDDVIKDRQDQLNHVEMFMSDINQIASSINTKVHEQRHDLTEVGRNTEEALTNTQKAEENIIEAAAKQKTGGRCMQVVIALIASTVLIIMICVLKLV